MEDIKHLPITAKLEFAKCLRLGENLEISANEFKIAEGVLDKFFQTDFISKDIDCFVKDNLAIYNHGKRLISEIKDHSWAAALADASVVFNAILDIPKTCINTDHIRKVR